MNLSFRIIFSDFWVENENFDPKVDNFIQYVYPEDLEYVLENLQKLQNKDKTQNLTNIEL